METEQAWQDLLTWFGGGTQITFKKNEILIRPEDSPRDLFFLESGNVKVYSLTSQGDENIRIFKAAGDVFPLVWAMRPVRRDMYFEAIEDLIVRRRSRKQLMEYINQHSIVGLALLEKFTDMYIASTERINNLEFRYARERIAYRLMFLAKVFGDKTALGTHINLPIRQMELADTINVTRETASRELRRLRRLNIISYKDNDYTILDDERLRKEYE